MIPSLPSPDEVFDIAADELDCVRRGPIHPQAILGLDLFNQGRYFEAHEALELAWRAERGAVRELYRSILQIGVGYYHIQRGNINGARKMFQRARGWLAPFPDTCRGINVAQLRHDAVQVEMDIQSMTPEQCKAYDPRHFKPVEYLYEAYEDTDER